MCGIDQLRKGDASAFEETYNMFHKKLYRFFDKHTHDRHQSEELAQLSFVKLWRHRQQLSNDFPLSQQIFRIAKTTMIDSFRRAESEKNALAALQREQENHQPFTEGNIAIDVTNLLQKTIRSMPSVQQKVFLLSRYGGLSNREIAAHLSISTKTVERHISKALRTLHKLKSTFGPSY